MAQSFGEWLASIPSQLQEAIKSTTTWLADTVKARGESRRKGRKKGPVVKEPQPTAIEGQDWRDPERRETALREVIQNAFGSRVPADLSLDALQAVAAHPDSFALFGDLCAVLGKKGCPCTSELLAGFAAMMATPRLLACFDRLTTLLSPSDEAAWGRLYALMHSLWGHASFERIFVLADGLTPLNRTLTLDSLDSLLKGLPDVHTCESFLQASRAFRACSQLSWDELDAIFVRFAKDEESAATIGEIGALLSQRGREDYRASDLEFIFGELTSRTAVKRYLQAFKILDALQIRFDEFDAFVASFARTSEDLAWLNEAVSGSQEIGRPVSRLSLVQLREWAPTTASLMRYVRGVRAFMGSGLTTDEVDQILLPHLESETEAAVMSLIGELGSRLFSGGLTVAKAKELFELLPDRAAVKRYEQAVGRLREAGMPPVDVDVLAPAFTRSSDDAIWLEAFVRNTAELSRGIERLELIHIRERCPEVSHMYRYFRLRKLFGEFRLIKQSEFEALAFDAVLDDEQSLLFLLENLIDWKRQDECTADEIRRLAEAFPGRAGVLRYKTAISNFEGSWDRLDALAMTYGNTDDRASIMAMVGRNLSAKRLNDIDSNPSLVMTLESVITKAEQGLPKT